ncbi:PEP-CTERM sorting domain-containing protein [Trichocoleus desertorum]
MVPTPSPTPRTKTVPEPSTLGAILLSGLMMLRYSKRGQKN